MSNIDHDNMSNTFVILDFILHLSLNIFESNHSCINTYFKSMAGFQGDPPPFGREGSSAGTNGWENLLGFVDYDSGLSENISQHHEL